MLTDYTKRVIRGHMKPPANPAALIEKLTPAALMAALGVSAAAVSNAKRRDAIPPAWWPAVLNIAKQTPGLGEFTFDDLVRIHTPAPRATHAEQRRRNPRAVGAGAR